MDPSSPVYNSQLISSFHNGGGGGGPVGEFVTPGLNDDVVQGLDSISFGGGFDNQNFLGTKSMEDVIGWVDDAGGSLAFFLNLKGMNAGSIFTAMGNAKFLSQMRLESTSMVSRIFPPKGIGLLSGFDRGR